ncbi:hypothetical protein PV797_11950 [Clostridiaceae bacterium M8S5]|nr:hypothetical protein PV797_11950 [Clostridiaceae bacterium M8S5]
MDLSFFVKSISLDDDNRIVVVAGDAVKDQLSNMEYRKQAKELLKKLLGDKFVKLEISSVSARVTTTEGTADECKKTIEGELNKYVQLAAQFMNNMSNMKQD